MARLREGRRGEEKKKGGGGKSRDHHDRAHFSSIAIADRESSRKNERRGKITPERGREEKREKREGASRCRTTRLFSLAVSLTPIFMPWRRNLEEGGGRYTRGKKGKRKRGKREGGFPSP